MHSQRTRSESVGRLSRVQAHPLFFQNSVGVGVVPARLSGRIAVKERFLLEMSFPAHVDAFQQFSGSNVQRIAMRFDPVRAASLEPIAHHCKGCFRREANAAKAPVEHVADLPGLKWLRFLLTKVYVPDQLTRILFTYGPESGVRRSSRRLDPCLLQRKHALRLKPDGFRVRKVLEQVVAVARQKPTDYKPLCLHGIEHISSKTVLSPVDIRIRRTLRFIVSCGWNIPSDPLFRLCSRHIRYNCRFFRVRLLLQRVHVGGGDDHQVFLGGVF